MWHSDQGDVSGGQPARDNHLQSLEPDVYQVPGETARFSLAQRHPCPDPTRHGGYGSAKAFRDSKQKAWHMRSRKPETPACHPLWGPAWTLTQPPQHKGSDPFRSQLLPPTASRSTGHVSLHVLFSKHVGNEEAASRLVKRYATTLHWGLEQAARQRASEHGLVGLC